jgi:fermentation-respiration switch protein FrsA (DUF1100 family)
MRALAALLAGLAALSLLLLGAVWLLQDRLIYFPDTERPPDPAQAGLPGVAAIEVTTADGLRLLAWQAAPGHADAPVLLYLHGNGGHLGYRANRLRRFRGLGWGVVMLEWRGYGGNPGRPGEAGLALDAAAGLAAVQAMGVPAGRIVVYGESLGSGLAVRLAAEQPAAIGALVLESPYTSLLALARLHYPLLPTGLLLRDRYDSLSRIGAVTVPTLILQGGQDRLIPPAMGSALAAAAARPVEVWLAPEGGHNDLGDHGAMEAVAAFLGRVLRGD